MGADTWDARVYVTPLFGAYIADVHLGRYKTSAFPPLSMKDPCTDHAILFTVCWAVLVAFIGQ
jgi:hypothetical protein